MIKYNPIALKPIDWATPLENVYNEQSAALDRYHAQLRERDRQEEAATLNIPEMLGKLASFSATVRDAQESKKAKKREKLANDLEDIKLSRREAKVDDRNVNKAILTISESEELKSDLVKFKAFLAEERKKGNLSQADADYLIARHGGQFVKEQEFVGWQQTKDVPGNYAAFMDNNADAQNTWDTNYNNLPARRASIESHQLDVYKKLGFTKDYIKDNLWGEVERQLDVKDVLGKIKYSKFQKTKRTEEIDKEVVVTSTKLPQNRNALTHLTEDLIQEGITNDGVTRTQAKDNLANRFYRLGTQGDFTEEHLDSIELGLLKGKHSAGKTGSVIFSVEQKRRIRQGINEYNLKEVKAAELTSVAKSLEWQETLINGRDTVPNLIKLKEEGLTHLARTLGTEHQSYKDLEKLDPTQQKPESYAATKKEWRPYFTGAKKGSRIQNEDAIKEIPNVKVRRELLALVAKDKQIRDDIGYPATFQANNTLTGEKIINANETLNEESHLTGTVGHMQIEITKKRDWFLADALERFPDDPQTAFGQADEAWEKWLTKEGFYVTADKPGAGRFSPETTGEYKNYKMWNSSRLEAIAKGDIINLKKWGTRVSKAKLNTYLNRNKIKDGANEIEKTLNTLNSVTDPEDLVGVWITGKPVYSPEIIVKARFLRTQPSNLVKRQLQALILSTDKRHKLLVKRFGLKEKLKNLKTPDIDLEEKITELGNRDLIFVVRDGIGRASPNQLKRIIDELTKNTDKKRTEQITKEGFADFNNSNN